MAPPSGPRRDALTGRQFGAYEFKEPLGAGGMGAVYRAWDSRLKRDVAVKVLPAEFSRDSGRVSRIQREAEIVASLNHPGICAIYDVTSVDGVPALVLELVDGETLAERLARGPMPVAEAIKAATQIAEALEVAHEHGIVHRDLKPANIKIGSDGRIKVLDFGLAKTHVEPNEQDRAAATTQTAPGTLLGTVPYMAPEQAKGLNAGPEADVWAFGCVLYEMLTGRKAFARATAAETIASVLSGNVDFDRLPADTPPLVRRLLRRCLQPAPRDRWRHIGDARADLLEAVQPAVDEPQTSVPRRRGSVARRAVIVGGLVVAALGAGWFAAQFVTPAAQAPARLSVPFFDVPRLMPFGSRHVAISADGSQLVFAGVDQLWVRHMSQKDPMSLGVAGSSPFFSPDGRWIAAFNDNKLVRTPTGGGTPVRIADMTERPLGGDWRADGTIAFATPNGLYRVSSEGGAPQLLATPNHASGEQLFASPEFLPDGRTLILTVVPVDRPSGFNIATMDIETKAMKVVLRGAASARYVRTGHLVYSAGGILKAVRFDPRTLQVEGAPFDLPDVEAWASPDNGIAEFAVSGSGTLVFLTGSTSSPQTTLVWTDRNGKEEPIAVEPRPYAYARVSPDGKRVALDVRGANRDVWILDLGRLTQVRLTDGPTEDMLPLWTRDGQRVFFASDRSGNFDIYSQAADGAGAAQLELARPGFQVPESFTSDGKRLFMIEEYKYLISLDLAAKRVDRWVEGTFENRLGQPSADGRWLAYESNESGDTFEIYVRPLADANARREKISVHGGRFPLWAPNGHELYYLDSEGYMEAVSVTLSPTLELGRTSRLFHHRVPPPGVSGRLYDVSPLDGRFLLIKPLNAPTGPTHVTVILNWLETLRPS